MANELSKISFLLLFFNIITTSYWKREFVTGDSNKIHFLSTAAGLNDLEIPSVVWNMTMCDAECQEKERHVLLDFYRSLGGKNWIHKWDIDASGTAEYSSFHCDWYGILCDNKTKHIIGIYLSHNNLRGELPVNVTTLEFLLSFSIGYNPVSGQFEKIVASMPKYLIDLDISNSKISGGIPKDIVSNVPILSKLKLHGSSVSGEIPEAIGDLVHLTVLNLGETKINGSIPQSISRLKNLWYLDLETLRLKGDLSFLYNLREIRKLHLLSNEISGPIPEFIGERCPNLTELRLPNNKLSGHLPKSLGMLSKLEILSVEQNNLSGRLPAYLFKLKLKVLVLSSNNFTGFEVGSNGTFTSLQVFMASHLPAFSCSIDNILSYLKGSKKTIMQIDVSHSNIHGQIPPSIYLFSSLTIIKLSSNMLTGPIPTPWQDLPFLTVVELQYNDLSGPIPMSFSGLLMLEDINLRGNKRLRGSVSSSSLVLDYQMKIKERQSDTCPILRFSHNNGTVYVDSSYYDRKYCYCDEQYFGSGIHCTQCLQGGSCPGATVAACSIKQLPADEVHLPASAMYLMRGHFPFPSESDVKSIHKCPPLGYNNRICVPDEGCGCYVSTKEEKVGIAGPVVATLNRTRIYCNTSCLCHKGHRGRFCSQCMQGYYNDGIHCYECYSKSRETGVILLYIFGTIFLFVFPICLYHFCKEQRYSVAAVVFELVIIVSLLIGKVTSPFFLNVALVLIYLVSYNLSHNCTALFESGMFYWQVTSSLISTTDIWPQWVHDVQAIVVSALNFHFSSLACSFPVLATPLARSTVLLLAPLFCIGLVWSLHCVLYDKKSKNEEEQQKEKHKKKFDVNHCKKYSLSILDVAYFPIAESCITVLTGCNNIDGVSFLKEVPWINCSSSEYSGLLVLAVIQALYIIILPAALFLYFRHIDLEDSTTTDTSSNAASSNNTSSNNTTRNNTSSNNTSSNDTSSNDTTPNKKWYFSFLAQYTPNRKHFKYLYFVLRRVTIAFFMAWLRTYPALLTSLSTVSLLLCICIQAIVRPLSSQVVESKSTFNLENVVDMLMLSTLIISIVCAEFSAGDEDWVQSTLLALIYVTNALFTVILCCSVLYRLRVKPCLRCSDTATNNRSGADKTPDETAEGSAAQLSEQTLLLTSNR